MAVGVTSGGDLFGGTQVTFTDVLGDKQFNIFAASVSQYRTMSFSYINLSRRLQYALQAYSQTQFYYGYDPATALRPRVRLHRSRPRRSPRRRRAARPASAIYPLNRYARVRAVRRASAVQAGVQRAGPAGASPIEYQIEQYGRTLFVDGTFMPLGVTLRAGDDGLPRIRAARRATPMSLGYEYAPERGQPAVATDVRRRRALLPAARHQRRARVPRARLQELGRVPRLHLLRRQLGAARLRLPGVPRQQGVLHQRRAAVPADRSGADADRRRRRPARRLLRRTSAPRATRASADDGCDVTSPTTVSAAARVHVRLRRRQAWRLRSSDSRAPSTGSGSWTAARRTASASRPSRSASRSTSTGPGGRSSTRTRRTTCSRTRASHEGTTGSQWLRKAKFSVWIGYDF